MSRALRLYRRLTELGRPLIDAYLRRRLKRGREDAVRFPERQGVAGQPRPEGTVVWVHGASVGEAASTLPVIARIRELHPDIRILATTGTLTSAALLAKRLPAGAIHQYVPVDRLPWVRRFLDHWRPDLALWVESDLWPNLVSETQARGIPMVLLNARMSPRSFERWRRLRGMIGALLGGFSLCLAQTPANAAYFRDLGADPVRCPGNLKFAASPLPADPAALAALETAVGHRPVWFAASTHDGEEKIAAAAHGRLAARHPDLLTIVAPRHPARGDAVARAARDAGLRVAQRSKGDLPDRDTAFYVADTLGELGLFYRAAGIVLIGGSLIPHGGQNPLEPARLDCALLHGPHMRNFSEIAEALDAAGASRVVHDAGTLAAAVADLLAEPAQRAAMAAAGQRVAVAEAHVLDAVMDELAPFLAAAVQAHARA